MIADGFTELANIAEVVFDCSCAEKQLRGHVRVAHSHGDPARDPASPARVELSRVGRVAFACSLAMHTTIVECCERGALTSAANTSVPYTTAQASAASAKSEAGVKHV